MTTNEPSKNCNKADGEDGTAVEKKLPVNEPGAALNTDVRLVMESPEREPAEAIQGALHEKVSQKEEGLRMDEARKLDSTGQTSLRVQLTWTNVTVIPKDQMLQQGCCSGAKPSGEKIKEAKRILNNVCGTVRPYQFLAIIGASGAGKTTLLNYLSNKMFPADLHASGVTTINGIVREQLDYYKFTAFVQQDDTLFEALTVQEVLEFAAALKCSADPKIREVKVQEMLSELELTQVKDLRIGGGMLGPSLSRGEKKRLSIAVELITNPALVFMDEPTTSMDTFTAEKIISIVNKLTRKGRTIIATIHQPNTEIYRHMDLLMLLSFGSVFYFGKANTAVEYFTSIGEPCPRNKNPAEFFMTMMTEEKADATKEQRLVKFTEAYEKSEMSKRYLEEEKALTKFENCNMDKLKYAATWPSQFAILYARAWTGATRNKRFIFMRYFIQVYFALVAIALFFQMSTNSVEGFTSRMGALFFCSNAIIMNALQISILLFPEERAVFMREQASSLYDVTPYFLSKILAELPFCIIDPLVMSVITYWAVGFNTADASKFFVFYFVMLACNLVSGAYSLFLGSFITNREVLIILIPILNIPLSLLSGWYVRLDDNILWPFQWISIFKYGFNGLAQNEFYDNPDIAVRTVVRIFNATTNTTIMRNVTIDANTLLGTMEAKLEIWQCFVACAVLYLGFLGLALLALKLSSRHV